MNRSVGTLVAVLAGLLLILTYLLARGATPDAARHERTLDALRTITLTNAALQRDVLRARGGLLRNYDPLVGAVEQLRDGAATLRGAGQAVRGDGRAKIERQADAVAAAVADQEALVEAFKSHNALLQNSLTYFTYMSGRLAAAGSGRPAGPTAEVGALATAMLRFLAEPRPDAAKGVTATLDRLDRQGADADLQSDIRSLTVHGRLILATLPGVDDLVSRLQAAPTSARVRVLQDIYLRAYGRAAELAGTFRILLYLAAVALLAYVAHLFRRLRANARALRERLDFEQQIAAMSTQFINLPRDHIGDGIRDGLERLATHTRLDRAQILLHRADQAGIGGSYLWQHPKAEMPACPPEDLLATALHWSLTDHERQGCVLVPDVNALPEGAERSRLVACGIRSWLCIPIQRGGQRVGFLALDAIAGSRQWSDDDIALLRMAAEIFANAIERERGESERAMLEARLQQTQRLEAIGTLAGGIAHEFNNILGAILGYAELALATLKRNGPARRHVRQIMKAGARAETVIDQILAFSRRRDPQYRPIRIQCVVAEAIELLQASLPATLSIQTRLGAGDAAVMGDRTELQQVVMNLCTNAAHAMDGRGVLWIGLDRVRFSADRTLSHGSLSAGDHVRLTVRDTGHGIEPAILERIVEPFFTTKAVGQGTGLGLSIVHGIVAQHGGALNIESRPGLGSTFEALFPRLEEAGIADEERPGAPAQGGHGETILIADDDQALVLLGEEMLAALGYEPVGFDRAAAALAAFEADPERFDLVLTDEIMPGMTGTELAGALNKTRPDLPVVLMTGGHDPGRPHPPQTAGIRETLKKPLRSATLAACLARHLPSRRNGPQREGAGQPGDRFNRSQVLRR